MLNILSLACRHRQNKSHPIQQTSPVATASPLPIPLSSGCRGPPPCRLEAAHLGDLLRLWVRFSPPPTPLFQRFFAASQFRFFPLNILASSVYPVLPILSRASQILMFFPTFPEFPRFPLFCFSVSPWLPEFLHVSPVLPRFPTMPDVHRCPDFFPHSYPEIPRCPMCVVRLPREFPRFPLYFSLVSTITDDSASCARHVPPDLP